MEPNIFIKFFLKKNGNINKKFKRAYKLVN